MKLLLVEDHLADAALLREMLSDVVPTDCELVHVPRLHDALLRLPNEPFDAILLDLGLPDARGLEALQAVQRAAPNLPIVILSGLADEALALDAVRKGAQDYLLKDETDGIAVRRAVRLATERKRAELRILHQAQHDSLTGLPNRSLLLDRVGQSLARMRREKKLLALLFIDVDGFKTVNDTRGHVTGDALLCSVASRLSACARQSDTVARIGGDEFTLVLPDISHVDDVHRLATKVLDALQRPFDVGGHEESISASVGISIFPTDGETAEALLQASDQAMYRAKQHGGGAFEFHADLPDETEGVLPCLAKRHRPRRRSWRARARRAFVR